MLSAKNEYKRFTKIIIAAILLLFMITSCIYESFKKPLIILMVLPLAMIGVFLIYYFTESYFTTGSYAGLILLFGLAVNNSIILVDYISKLEKEVYQFIKQLFMYQFEELNQF